MTKRKPYKTTTIARAKAAVSRFRSAKKKAAAKERKERQMESKQKAD